MVPLVMPDLDLGGSQSHPEEGAGLLQIYLQQERGLLLAPSLYGRDVD